MMREEREVVIQFSLIPMGVMPSSLAEYHAGDITKDGLEELRHKSFLSDSVFNIGMRHGTKMAEYLARKITGDESIRIEKVITQYGIENLGHSVRMDALAVDSKGRMIDFEMQMERDKDINRRMRMYESSFKPLLVPAVVHDDMALRRGPAWEGEGGVHVAVEGPGEHGDG